MKKNYFTLFILLAFCFPLKTYSQSSEKCLSDLYFREYAKLHPEIIEQRKKFMEEAAKVVPEDDSRSVPRIIPVVFHVIHQGGTENISRAQILDQIRIFNEDYRRLNADAASTPAAFQGAAADCNVEFRLAQKDPSGNCTDGVVRVYSYLTNHVFFDQRVKALSYWSSTKYLNVWVVKNIIGNIASGGAILGYSTIPPSTPASEDGVILRSDCVGAIGTAITGSFPMEAGRAATHELGHWLGLYHIWGDDVCGDDLVADTPPAVGANMNCPTFPHNPNNSCGAGPNGEMFSNYMDYSDGNCLNIYTTGQKQVMDYTFVNFRPVLISASNLTATGTSGTPAVLCKPMSDFAASATSVCAGGSVTYTSYSYNADTISTYNWTFPGGTPASSSAASPTVVYSTPGTYSASLTVTNSAGNNNKTRSSYIKVFGAAGYAVPYSNSFESASEFTHVDSYVINDDGGNAWQRVTNAGSTGSSSIRINNFSGNHNNEVDAYLTTSFNFTYVTQPMLTFQVAYAQKNSTSDDVLRVYVSTNCGQTWQVRYYKHGTTLMTAPTTGTNFTPNSTQWRMETINLTAYQGMSNVRFKFECTSNQGNNIFVDDINISGIVGMDEIFAAPDFKVYPNPSGGNIFILFTLPKETEAEIIFSDALGRTVLSLEKNKYPVGENSIPVENNLSSGMYFVHLRTKNSSQTKRLVMMRD